MTDNHFEEIQYQKWHKNGMKNCLKLTFNEKSNVRIDKL